MNKLIQFSVLAMLTGCATTAAHMKSLQEGMTQKAVIEKLGKPDGMKRDGNTVTIVYFNRLMHTWGAKERTDYTVVFNEDKLVAYGPGAVRQSQQENVSWIIPINTAPPPEPAPMSPGEYFDGMPKFGKY